MAKKKEYTIFELALSNLQSLTEIKWASLIKEATKRGDLRELCLLWDQLDKEYTKINEARKDLLALFERLDKEILPQVFENQKIDKIALPELAKTFYPLHKNSASIAKGRNEEAMSWLRANGLGPLVTETVNRNTLAATLYGRLINEGKDPPDSMTLTRYTIISSSKYTPKEK